MLNDKDMEIKRIAVFCGSSSGASIIYEEQAYLLGKTLALNGIEVVYGGANVGLMKVVADGAIDHGGKVTGVLPGFLKDKELNHERLTKIVIVKTMHERKYKMNQLCDGVIALPGGYGTMDEFFEMMTWGQLGLHKKPVAALNINGFYDPLISLAGNMWKEGFLKKEYLDSLLVGTTIEEVMSKIKAYQAPEVGKWI